MVRVLFLLLLALSASAADGLPDADPRTVVQGAEMVDAALALLQKKSPGLKVHSGLQTFEMEVIKAEKQRIKNRYPDSPLRAKAFTPGTGIETFNLLGKLHNGQKISLSRATMESTLQDWLYYQADRSVLPHELLAQALYLENGNALYALTDIWNVLSPNWEAAATRNASPYAQKLYDVTGEFNLRDGAGQFVITDKAADPLAPIEKKIKFMVTKRGDVFSTYYHFFGAMLYSQYTVAKTGQPLAGKLAGRLAVQLESKLYRKTSGLNLEREKRILNDIEGANAGARLGEIAKNPERAAAVALPATGEIPSYLKPDRRLSKEYLLEADGRAPVHFRSTADGKFRQGPMSVEELKLRFEYAVTANEEIFNPYILATSSDGERLQNGLQLYVKDGAKDPELNAWIQKFRSGWKGPAKSVVDFSLYEPSLQSHIPWDLKFDLLEARRRVGRQMDLVLAKSGLPLLTEGPPVPKAEGTVRKDPCGLLYQVLGDMARQDWKRRRE